MSYEARTPYPNVKAVITLPNPEWGDSEASEQGLNVHRFMDGTYYTNTVTSSNKIFRWTFKLTRSKAIEFREAYKLYAGEKWSIDSKVGYIRVNPSVLDIHARAVGGGSLEEVLMDLEFEQTE